MNSPSNEEMPEEYEGATEEEIDTYYAWEYCPEYRPLAKVNFRPPLPPAPNPLWGPHAPQFWGENTFKFPQNWGMQGGIQDLCKRSYEQTLEEVEVENE